MRARCRNIVNAFEVVREAKRVQSEFLRNSPNVPPTLTLKHLPGLEYLGTDQVGALELARSRDCMPGHVSIIELEHYMEVLRTFGLVR